MSYEKATLKVEKQQAFDELKAAIECALAARQVEKFLKKVRAAGLRIRNFDGVLEKGVLDANRERRSLRLYDELPVSDQAQIREFYLSRIEDVSPELRHRFLKLYQYY